MLIFTALILSAGMLSLTSCPSNPNSPRAVTSKPVWNSMACLASPFLEAAAPSAAASPASFSLQAASSCLDSPFATAPSGALPTLGSALPSVGSSRPSASPPAVPLTPLARTATTPYPLSTPPAAAAALPKTLSAPAAAAAAITSSSFQFTAPPLPVPDFGNADAADDLFADGMPALDQILSMDEFDAVCLGDSSKPMQSCSSQGEFSLSSGPNSRVPSPERFLSQVNT